jgi:hypothetical protein
MAIQSPFDPNDDPLKKKQQPLGGPRDTALQDVSTAYSAGSPMPTGGQWGSTTGQPSQFQTQGTAGQSGPYGGINPQPQRGSGGGDTKWADAQTGIRDLPSMPGDPSDGTGGPGMSAGPAPAALPQPAAPPQTTGAIDWNALGDIGGFDRFDQWTKGLSSDFDRGDYTEDAYYYLNEVAPNLRAGGDPGAAKPIDFNSLKAGRTPSKTGWRTTTVR